MIKPAKIGFTGTKDGMTPQQKRAFLYTVIICWSQGALKQRGFDKTVDEFTDSLIEFHHGDCVGADADAHQIVSRIFDNDTSVNIVVHPPSVDKYRAFVEQTSAVKILRPLPYLKRNQAIVDQTDSLIATPNSKEEQLRSGTWSTIRRARKANKNMLIIWPDGSVGTE